MIVRGQCWPRCKVGHPPPIEWRAPKRGRASRSKQSPGGRNRALPPPLSSAPLSRLCSNGSTPAGSSANSARPAASSFAHAAASVAWSASRRAIRESRGVMAANWADARALMTDGLIAALKVMRRKVARTLQTNSSGLEIPATLANSALGLRYNLLDRKMRDGRTNPYCWSRHQGVFTISSRGSHEPNDTRTEGDTRAEGCLGAPCGTRRADCIRCYGNLSRAGARAGQFVNAGSADAERSLL